MNFVSKISGYNLITLFIKLRCIFCPKACVDIDAHTQTLTKDERSYGRIFQKNKSKIANVKQELC